MEGKFNSLEVIKMAMNIEEQGEKFYTHCAQAQSNSTAKKIFNKLSQDENDHYQLFSNMLKEFENQESINRDYLENQEVNGYLSSLVNSKVFPETKEEAEKIATNSKEAINRGIQAEKDSLLLYLELVKLEKDKTTIEALERLILEEKKHLTQLKDLKSKLVD